MRPKLSIWSGESESAIQATETDACDGVKSGLKPWVSGSDSPDPDRQIPAEFREFLGLRLSMLKESLLAQTQWR